MVKSVPMSSSQVSKPKAQRKGGAGGIVFVFITLLAVGVFLLGSGFLMPARLGIAQEFVLSVLHGGIAASNEELFVDGCVQGQEGDGPYAVTRTHRTINFKDGTSLTITFNSTPVPTNTQCN